MTPTRHGRVSPRPPPLPPPPPADIMALKRKRSSAILPSSPSESPFSDSDLSSPAPPQHPPSHLSSRTMKRHRDNRPDEQMVHAQTLAKLFDAQRRAHQSPPPPSPVREEDDPMDAAQEDVNKAQPKQRSTLHCFWQMEMD